jgi:hypothetical protein
MPLPLTTGITRKNTFLNSPRPKFDQPKRPRSFHENDISNAIQDLENKRVEEIQGKEKEDGNSIKLRTPKIDPKLINNRMSRLGTTEHLPVKREITEDEKNKIIKEGHILCVKSYPPRAFFF